MHCQAFDTMRGFDQGPNSSFGLPKKMEYRGYCWSEPIMPMPAVTWPVLFMPSPIMKPV